MGASRGTISIVLYILSESRLTNGNEMARDKKCDKTVFYSTKHIMVSHLVLIRTYENPSFVTN